MVPSNVIGFKAFGIVTLSCVNSFFLFPYIVSLKRFWHVLSHTPFFCFVQILLVVIFYFCALDGLQEVDGKEQRKM